MEMEREMEHRTHRLSLARREEVLPVKVSIQF
jgi:hypothetical protein